MIYTLGDKESYLRAIQEISPDRLKKLGRKGEPGDEGFYAGGIAFHTPKEAEEWNLQHGKPEWIVWGLESGWDNTYLYKDETFRIIETVPIISLVEAPFGWCNNCKHLPATSVRGLCQECRTLMIDNLTD
jgi:hypothetical protein